LLLQPAFEEFKAIGEEFTAVHELSKAIT